MSRALSGLGLGCGLACACACLTGQASAAEPIAAVTSAVSLGEDFGGSLLLPYWQTAWVGVSAGSVRAEAYGELAWASGVDRPGVPLLHVASAAGRSGAVDWCVGRQRILLPQLPRMLDGAQARWRGSGPFSLSAAAGWAEHPAVPWEEGAGLARVAAHVETSGVVAAAGFWLEGGPASAPALHPDLSLRWARPDTRRAPALALVLAGGVAPDRTVLERARLEFALRPRPGTRVVAHVEHREVLDPASVLGGGILATFAPHGTNEVGLGAGWSSVRRDEFWMSGTLATWDERPANATATAQAGPEVGGTVAASWRPSCRPGDWCGEPVWRVASGPGGIFHAFGGSVTAPPVGAVTLGGHAFLAPGHTPHAQWSLASVAGLDGRLALPMGSIAVAGELGHRVAGVGAAAGWSGRAWALVQVAR